MSAIDHLSVIWGDPARGRRHVIGHLARTPLDLRFWYEDDVSEAVARGFRLMPEFPEHRTESDPYTARYLFALFAERIPSPDRPDRDAMLARWGVAPEAADDPFEILARSGGIRATDRLELAEYRDAGDDLTRPLEFRVSGRRYLDLPAPLARGTSVHLVRDRGNDADPCATYVHVGERPAGYVPRQYSAIAAHALDGGARIEGTVLHELIVPDDAGRWVVRVARVAPSPSR